MIYVHKESRTGGLRSLLLNTLDLINEAEEADTGVVSYGLFVQFDNGNSAQELVGDPASLLGFAASVPLQIQNRVTKSIVYDAIEETLQQCIEEHKDDTEEENTEDV